MAHPPPPGRCPLLAGPSLGVCAAPLARPSGCRRARRALSGALPRPLERPGELRARTASRATIKAMKPVQDLPARTWKSSSAQNRGTPAPSSSAPAVPSARPLLSSPSSPISPDARNPRQIVPIARYRRGSSPGPSAFNLVPTPMCQSSKNSPLLSHVAVISVDLG
ncbi:hypothetical protein RhiJN_03045 [Ceratobasidium sp. AG-Ba]|nr:hypothetical protein RhiJN_03045 [Ceratobasidium sp. AG-Ba]